MKTWTRRIGGALLVLIVVAILATIIGKKLGERKMARTIPVTGRCRAGRRQSGSHRTRPLPVQHARLRRLPRRRRRR
jgi:hypothetical protein